MIERVISGGQTGADQAGLAVAKRLGVPTGGYLPKGWLTEAGPRPDLGATYGLEEAETAAYPERTERNVLASDGTVRVRRCPVARLHVDRTSVHAARQALPA